MKRKLTGDDIELYIKEMIESRKPTENLAHEEFNKGVKFATDYVLEFINTVHRMTRWEKILKKLGL